MNKKKLFSFSRDLVIFALILFAITSWQARHLLDSDGSVEIDQQQLVSLDGKSTSLTEPGKRTLLYFFAPWCNICKLSIGNLEYLQSEDLNVVRVALDYRSRGEVEDFVIENDVVGDVLLGNNDHKKTFNIPGYPTYYLLDENNKVVASSFGYSTALGLKLTNYLNSK